MPSKWMPSSRQAGGGYTSLDQQQDEKANTYFNDSISFSESEMEANVFASTTSSSYKDRYTLTLKLLRGPVMSTLFLIIVALALFYNALITTTRTGNTWKVQESLLAADLSMYSVQQTNITSQICRDARLRMNLGPLNYESAKFVKERPQIGLLNLFDQEADQCVTYKERYSRYTDESLGMKYRYNRSQLEIIDKDVTFVPLIGPIKPRQMKHEEYNTWLQNRMQIINSNLSETQSSSIIDWKALMDGCGLYKSNPIPNKKTAILFRIYKGYVLTEDGILNLRALITELSISQPEAGYDVRIMVNVPDASGVYSSQSAQEDILAPMLPREFWNLVFFWSREEVAQVFPCGGKDPELYGPSLDCHGSDQLFSARHPEYDFLYHWEADVRFFGDYRNFIDASEAYARSEPMSHDLVKYRHHYLSNSQKSQAEWSKYKKEDSIGQGSEADLITFNPIFDPILAEWNHRSKIENFGLNSPRLSSVIAFVRMSKRMYQAWDKAIVDHHKQLHCESWPQTLVLHSHLPSSPSMAFHGDEGQLKVPLKGVYVPHPIYFQNNEKNTTIMEDNLLRNDLYSQQNEGFLFDSTFHPIAHFAQHSYLDWRKGTVASSRCARPHMVHPAKYIGYE